MPDVAIPVIRPPSPGFNDTEGGQQLPVLLGGPQQDDHGGQRLPVQQDILWNAFAFNDVGDMVGLTVPNPIFDDADLFLLPRTQDNPYTAFAWNSDEAYVLPPPPTFDDISFHLPRQQVIVWNPFAFSSDDMSLGTFTIIVYGGNMLQNGSVYSAGLQSGSGYSPGLQG